MQSNNKIVEIVKQTVMQIVLPSNLYWGNSHMRSQLYIVTILYRRSGDYT